MAKLLQTLIQILTMALSLLVLASNVHSEDTVSFAYDYFYPTSADLIYQGDAHVPSDQSFLRLVETDSAGNPQGYSVGRVLYSKPILFWEPGRQASFNTTMRFFITPVDSTPADGMTFFIAPVGSNIPSDATGGNLGVFDSSGNARRTFAIEYDVYINGWDPQFRHVGIDVESRDSRHAVRFENAVREDVEARINYDSPTRRITVTVTSGSATFEVSDEFDLKSILNQYVQVGISGATGAAVALHDLLSWSFTSTMMIDKDYNGRKQMPYIRKYGGI